MLPRAWEASGPAHWALYSVKRLGRGMVWEHCIQKEADLDSFLLQPCRCPGGTHCRNECEEAWCGRPLCKEPSSLTEPQVRAGRQLSPLAAVRTGIESSAARTFSRWLLRICNLGGAKETNSEMVWHAHLSCGIRLWHQGSNGRAQPSWTEPLEQPGRSDNRRHTLGFSFKKLAFRTQEGIPTYTAIDAKEEGTFFSFSWCPCQYWASHLSRGIASSEGLCRKPTIRGKTWVHVYQRAYLSSRFTGSETGYPRNTKRFKRCIDFLHRHGRHGCGDAVLS